MTRAILCFSLGPVLLFVTRGEEKNIVGTYWRQISSRSPCITSCSAASWWLRTFRCCPKVFCRSLLVACSLSRASIPCWRVACPWSSATSCVSRSKPCRTWFSWLKAGTFGIRVASSVMFRRLWKSISQLGCLFKFGAWGSSWIFAIKDGWVNGAGISVWIWKLSNWAARV